MATKPSDFIERSTRDFEPGVDVATVDSKAKPEDLLFGKPAPPPVDAEPQEEFFKWDGEKEVDGQKGAFYVDVENNGRIERFWGKTRTEVTKNLAEGKKNANQALAEQKQANKQRQPDMKLPFEPIQRRAPRTLTQQEVYQITELAQTDPLRAQEMLFEARTGYTMAEVAQSVATAEDMRLQVHAATASGAFLARHTKDFLANQGNMTLIDSWLKDRKLPVTENNLEIAFADLDAAGKLQKPEASTPTAKPEEFTPPPPPVSPPARPAPGVAPTGGTALTREQVAAIQSGSLSEARSAIQDVFRANRGNR